MIRMKQQLESKAASQKGGRHPRMDFSALFLLAGSKWTGESVFRAKMGLGDAEYSDLLEDLQGRALIDLSSNLEGSRVRVNVRLTEDGEATLLHLLEKMCELPEASTFLGV
jgi:hypothetical protein